MSVKLNVSLLWGLLFLYVASCSPNAGPFPLTQLQESPSVTTTDCGGVLNETSGEISYKLYEPFGPNERCVWIIRAQNTTDYTIGVFNLGFPSPHPNHQVTVSGFALGRNITQVIP